MKIDLNLEENKILISSKENYENLTIDIYNWNPYDNTEAQIYSKYPVDLNNEYVYWFIPGAFMNAYFGISAYIKQNDRILKFEKFRIKTIHGSNIKNQALVLWSSTGLGDNLFCTPIIKKLYEIYNRKITLYTYFPEIFINSPYIENIIKIESDIEWGNVDQLNIDTIKFEIHNIGHGHVKPFNILDKNHPDIINLFAHQIGLHLNEDEKFINFFPDDCEILNLPKYYIVINPNKTHGPRTWGSNNYNELIKMLNQIGIFVIALGKDVDYEDKSSLKDINISYGLNLINKTSLFQAWHIINGSVGFISHTSGLFQLAMSTSTIIFELGSYCSFSNWVSRNYKNVYIEGECKLQCYNNNWCGVSENGTINSFLSTYNCHLGFDYYKCHPSTEDVIKKIIEYYKHDSLSLHLPVLKKYKTKNFIESGTYHGGACLCAYKVGFDKIYSIELNDNNYKLSYERLIQFDNIKIFHGDSVYFLPVILNSINEQCTIWLDGHDNYNCPVLRELDKIKEHHIKNHIILIDDVQSFGTEFHENITIEEIKTLILTINPDYEFSYEDSSNGKNDILVAKVRK